MYEQYAPGPGAGRNLGARESRSPALAFCDADCFPTPGWLRAGVDALKAADLVQGHVLPDPDSEVGPFDHTIWITFEVGLYETASLFVRRETFERVGGFEDWISPENGRPVGEDVWFGWRARRLGARTAFCADALAHHAVFPRGWRDYVAERERCRYFPAMAAKVPELRSHFFYARLFLNRRHAALDVGLLGALTALALRSPLPLLAGVPYGVAVRRRTQFFPSGRLGIAAADVAADLLGLASLLRGSLRYRSPVL